MLLLQYFLLDAIGTFLGGPSNVNVNMTESQVTDRSSRVLNSGDQAELLENFLNSIVGFFVGSFFYLLLPNCTCYHNLALIFILLWPKTYFLFYVLYIVLVHRIKENLTSGQGFLCIPCHVQYIFIHFSVW